MQCSLSNNLKDFMKTIKKIIFAFHITESFLQALMFYRLMTPRRDER